MDEYNICVFGASITWGAYDYDKGGWVERLKIALFDEDIFVYNCGRSGNRIDHLIKRIKNEFLARKSNSKGNKIIISIGANDCSVQDGKTRTSLEDYNKGLEKVYLICKELADEVIFTGLTKVDESRTTPVSWVDVHYLQKNVEEYNEAIEYFCKQNKVKFIPLLDLDLDLEDGLHPDSKGHEKIFLRVKEYLEV